VASRKCDHCGASVAADEQFCPNCGSFLDPLEPKPARGRENVISVSSDGNYEEFELGAPPPPAERSQQPVLVKAAGRPPRLFLRSDRV